MGVEHITPRMYREGGASILTPKDIRRRLEAALRAGAPARRVLIHQAANRSHWAA